MAPSPSAEPDLPPPLDLAPGDLDLLFALQDASIRGGFRGDGALRVDPRQLSPALRLATGAFVTLEVAGELNGCIGVLESDEPLGVSAPRLAWESAFQDPRLPKLRASDYPQATLELSLLGHLAPVAASTEAILVAELQPGVDGLLIDDGWHRATFLPAVWRHLPDSLAFVRQLAQKARLSPGLWPSGMRAWRYRAVEHKRAAREIDPTVAAYLLSDRDGSAGPAHR